MIPTSFNMTLPSWLQQWAPVHDVPHPADTDKMALVLDVLERHLLEDSGGPFAAIVFGPDQRPLAYGVNLVTGSGCSILHAEMVVLMLAQKALARPHLGPGYTLASSAEPCAMCLGAIPWAHVDHVICAATDADVRATGFDEGSKPQPWQQALTDRGISVVQRVAQARATAALQHYARQGGARY